MLTQGAHPPQRPDATTPNASPAELQPLHRPAKRRKISQPINAQLAPFQLFPHPPSSRIETNLTVIPQFILPRARLPLHFLDTTLSPAEGPLNSQFFSANARVLEQTTTSSRGVHTGSQLLIARLDNPPNFYAVERVCRGIYSLCRLASWVDMATLQTHAVSQNFAEPSIPHPGPVARHEDETPNNWWASAIVNPKSNSTPAAAKPEAHIAVAPVDDALAATENAVINQTDSSTDPSMAQTSFDDIRSTLIQQYLDTLYCSKAPITFFAKGALSRARALATASGRLSDLASFLRSLVFTVPIAEGKYKHTVPDLVKSLGLSADSNADTSPKLENKCTKTRKAKTFKPKKNGLFPGEESFINAWCLNLDSGSYLPTDSTLQATRRNQIGRLRLRETLLQLVLSFEVLYLESSLETPETHATVTDGAPPEAGRDSQQTKAKRPRDFAKLIDILIDRLIIWQSIHIEEVAPPTDALDHESSVATETSSVGQVSDELKDFYLQLLSPFYGSRLPVLVKQVGKKLGISRGISSKVRPAARTSSDASKIAPGTEISRSSLIKDRKSLQRVSSETLNAKRQPHSSLFRSVTDNMVTKAMLSQDKTAKDLGDTSTTASDRRSMSRSNSIAQDDRTRRSLSRTSSLSHMEDSQRPRPLSRSNSVSLASQSLKQREVDLSAIAKFKRAKPKKADVEQELQDAISALKRPNRSLAGQKYMEAAEARVATGRPRHKTSRVGVEVTSTPKRPGRAQQGVAATPERSKAPHHCDEIPASTPCVPMSAARQTSLQVPELGKSIHSSFVASTPAAKPKASPIFETPSRGHERSLWNSSQTNGRDFEELVPGRGVAQTPTHARSSHGTHAKHVDMQPAEESNASIYEMLGWDNDIDDLA